MTATSSRNALPFRNALRVVSQNKKTTIVTCILQLLGIPLAMTATMLSLIADSHTYQDGAIYEILEDIHVEVYAAIGCMLAGAAIFMGMFIAINSFTEMHKKTKVDMLYALPLTGTQRFFSNYLGGCMMYIVPYIIAVILGWIAMFVFAPFVAWGSNYMGEFGSFGAFLGEVGKLYAMGTVGMLLLMLLYFSLAVLVTVCCGTLFECIYTNILLNCLIPGTIALIIAVVTNAVDLDFEYTWQIVGFMSPIGGLFYLVMLLSGELDDSLYSNAYTFKATQTISHEMLPSYIRWAFVIFLLTAALTAGAWLLYKRRKAEEVGKPFVYILAYYVMLTLGTMALLCIAGADDDFIGPAIFISAIAYFIMEVIRKRGFKKFWLSIVTYIATVTVSIACYGVIVSTDCFGRVNYVPAAIGVSSVRVEYNLNDEGYRGSGYQLEYTDREVINEIVKLHHDAVDARKGEKTGHDYNEAANKVNARMLAERWALLSYDNSSVYNTASPYELHLPYSLTDSYYGSDETKSESDWLDPNVTLPDCVEGEYCHTNYVQLTYYTLTGTTIHRSYNMTADEMQRLYSIVRGTELYANAMADGLSARLTNEYSEYNDKEKRVVLPENVRFSITNYGGDSRNDTSAHTVYLRSAAQRFAQLTEAYRNDLAGMTEENFRTSDVFGYICQIPVYECCTDTIALLKEFGLEGFTVADRYGFMDKERTIAAGEAGLIGLRIYAPENSRTESELYPHSSAGDMYFKGNGAYEDTIYASAGTDLEKSYPELHALMKAARRYYVSDGDCYVLFFNGASYIVPEADTALAEAVIAKGNNYMKKWYSSNPSDLGWATTYGNDYFS